MAVKNRFKYWRHRHEMNQIEFADYLGIGRNHYNRMEKHPDKYNPNTTTMYGVWLRVKERFPDCHLEDMWDYVHDPDSLK